jgi:hypothetical protein
MPIWDNLFIVVCVTAKGGYNTPGAFPDYIARYFKETDKACLKTL